MAQAAFSKYSAYLRHLALWSWKVLYTRRWSLLLLFGGIALPLLALGEIVEEVFLEEEIVHDDATLLWINQHLTTPWMDSVMVFITDLGRIRQMTVFLAFALGLLIHARRSRDALFFAVAYIGAVNLNVLAKAVFQRRRPALWDSISPEHTYSFPSGHAMSAAAFAAAVLFVTWNTRWRIPALIIAPTFAILVGFSRAYLGVHYPTDIVAGWLAATAWVVGVHAVIMRGAKPVVGQR